MKTSLKITIYSFLAIILVAVCINVGMILYGNQWIVDSTQEKEVYPYGMILGASVKADGSLSQILKSRVDAAIDAYQRDLIEKFFVSGDDQEHYREVSAIHRYLTGQGISQADIMIDGVGKSTYTSMRRAKYVYKIEKMLVFTQQYHLSRSLYIARHLGIQADGYIVDVHADVPLHHQVREFFARIKSFSEILLTRPLP